MPTLALALLFQAVAATPTPTPTPTPPPAPKRTPVAASGAGATRTLSDVAKERKLEALSGEVAPKPAGLTVAPAGGGIGGKALPAASSKPTAKPAAGAGPAIVVESVEHGSVGSTGQVRVFGTVRNAGDAPVCDVSVAVRLYDDRNGYLVSGAAKLDEPVLKPGGRSSFSVFVQVPPGVVGSLKDKDLTPGTTGGSLTLEGSWRTLGRAEAEGVSAADSCPGEKPPEEPAAKESEPATAQTPTPTSG